MEQLDLFSTPTVAPEPIVRHARAKYGWRASIDLPGTRGSLHVSDRSLFAAVQGVRAKYAAWLEVSRTFGWQS